MEEIQRANEELERLESKVQEQVNQARVAKQEIDEEVGRWLEEVRVLRSSEWFSKENEKTKTTWKGKWFSKDKLKRRQEDVLRMKALIDHLVLEGKNLLCVLQSSKPVGIDLLWRRGFVNFSSRKGTFDEIMEGLRDETLSIIGICGMGGIGKTEFVKQIGQKAKDGGYFKKVLLATVSRTPIVRKIQGQLADMLGIRLKEETETGRANELRVALDKECEVLVIFDDIWEGIDFNSLGVPLHLNKQGLKIVLTTRLEQVCNSMCCRKVIRLDVLEESEAWILFDKHSELRGKSAQVHNYARRIVRECGGLPLAIVAVGSALRGKSAQEYENAALKLSNSTFVDIETVDRDIYSSLKLSYDYLETEETRNCFLLCSLFPENSSISVEDLMRYAFGLCVFSNVDSMEDVRKRIFDSVKRLVEASLLSPEVEEDDSYWINFLERNGAYLHEIPEMKMHDMVRHVALWISKCKGSLFFLPTSFKEFQRKDLYKKATVISVDENLNWEFPGKLECLKLEILLMNVHYSPLPGNRLEIINCLIYNQNLAPVLYIIPIKLNLRTVPDGFFEELGDHLQVLRILHRGNSFEVCLQQPLPSSLQHLCKLRSLHLCTKYWTSDQNISILGNLHNLEALTLECNVTKKLPHEIGNLSNLRFLDVSSCEDITIPDNLLSRLTQLEELYTMPKWDWRNVTIAAVSELQFLPRLTVFTGCFRGIKCFPPQFRFTKLQRYEIDTSVHVHIRKWMRKLRLDDLDASSMTIIDQLIHNVEVLDIRGSGSLCSFNNIIPQVDDKGFQELRVLRLDGSSLKCLIDTTELPAIPSAFFSNLETLEFRKMPELSRILFGPPPLSYLGNLRKLVLSMCPKLRNIVPDMLPVAPKLDRLHIRNSDGLKHVYQLEPQALEYGKVELHLLPFPTTIFLYQLKELQSIWKGPNSTGIKMVVNEEDDAESRIMLLEAAMLRSMNSFVEMKIQKCDQLQEIFYLRDLVNQANMALFSNLVKLNLIDLPELECIWRGPPQKYRLSKLERIEVLNCDKLTVLFTHALAKSLFKLKYLNIRECKSLKTIIAPEEGDDLNSVSSFQHIIFPELDDITIQSCENLETLFPMSFDIEVLPKLRTVSVKFCNKLEEVLGYDQQGVAASSVMNSETAQGSASTSTNFQDVERPSSGGTFHSKKYFPALEEIDIEQCGQLKTVLPVSFDFPKLKSITIINCAELKHIFGDGQENLGQTCETILNSLEKLNLFNLPRLSIQSLFHLKVDKCLKTSRSSRVSQPSRLNQQDQNHIMKNGHNCEILQDSMISDEHEKYTGLALMLGRLQTLKLGVLPDIHYVWKTPSTFIDHCNIREIEVTSLRDIRILFSRTIAKTLHSLRSIHVGRCEELEHIIEPQTDREEEFDLQDPWKALVSMYIFECGNLTSLFPLSVVQDLQALEYLEVEECPQLKHIFNDDILEERNTMQLKEIQLPNLENLRLVELENLTSFAPANWHVYCPRLDEPLPGVDED